MQVYPKATNNTRAVDLTQTIADDIISGRIVPGTKLDEAVLANRFRVSRTPVREALKHLSATALVVSQPRRGAFAANITSERMLEMFEALAEVDAICARLCALKMSIAERARLQELHEKCRIAQADDIEGYHHANWQFHTAIYNGTHNSFLSEQAVALRTRFAPFSRAQFRSTGRVGRSFAEHDAVVRAILASDGDGALQAMRKHGLNTGRAYAAYMGELADRKAD